MPDVCDPSRSARLETAMQAALAGSRSAARAFFELLLEAVLFVPERRQAQPLSNTPRYPNDFFNFLGVQDRERTVMPVFTESGFISTWCGNQLTFREASLRSLLEILPEDWWVVINPGRDVEKELSPWEIAHLKEGPRGIDEVLEEIFTPEMTETLDVRPCKDSECPELWRVLRAAGKDISQVARISLMREEGRDADGQTLTRLLVGVEAPGASAAELARIRLRVSDAARPCQIGGDELRVLVSQDGRSSPAIGMFKDAPPVYARSWLAAMKAFFRRKTKKGTLGKS